MLHVNVPAILKSAQQTTTLITTLAVASALSLQMHVHNGRSRITVTKLTGAHSSVNVCVFLSLNSALQPNTGTKTHVPVSASQKLVMKT